MRENEDQPLVGRPLRSSIALESGERIGEARDATRRFMTEVQAVHGIPVSERAMGLAELVVSELVTNAHKYAPGPCLLDVEVCDGTVDISVWDSDPALPVPQEADPHRVGKHGLEIVMAVCRSFEIHREPVGKRVKAGIVLADDPGGHPAGRLM
ncbi:ATP-binding protein [Streptomyces sp. 378]|uniref:ATP-binding protein n=1 Tax=Streptomyces sp. 378 TaxID=3049412 RepID=UPI0024C46905|nr:ATP-binding protein [Streptomyces sp. 378]MDK1348141.1 ATP-binding protein [Streptomyces sp. 378]